MKNKELSVDVIQETSWKRALNAARRTIGKEPIDKEPSKNWKAKSERKFKTKGKDTY